MTLHQLTPAQLQLARLIEKGFTYDEIADELGISRRTAVSRTDRLRWIFGVEKKRQLPEVMRKLGYLK